MKIKIILVVFILLQYTDTQCQYLKEPMFVKDTIYTYHKPLFMVFNPSFNYTGEPSQIQRSYTQCLPLFCKIEYLFEKSSNINLRVRLGDLDYVNYLEKK